MNVYGIPLTAVVPKAVSDPVIVDVRSLGLRLAVVEREFVASLGAEWDVPGNHTLLEPAAPGGSFAAYVGKAAPGGVRSCLMDHVRNKDKWVRAVTIQRVGGWMLNSAEVGWQEGRLYDLLAASTSTTMRNGNRPVDETLPEYDRAMLEHAIEPVLRLLRLIGYPLDRPVPVTGKDQGALPGQPDAVGLQDAAPTAIAAVSEAVVARRYRGHTLEELIAAGVLPVGLELNPTDPSARAVTATVTDEGLEMGGIVYTAPSPAATKARGKQVFNGWSFWATPDGDTLAELRERYEATHPPSVVETRPLRLETDGLFVRTRADGSQTYSVTVDRLILAGVLTIGQRLVPTNLKRDGEAFIVSGGIEFDGAVYPSLSAAARAADPGKSINGWDFWGVVDGATRTSLSVVRNAWLATLIDTRTEQI